MWWAIITTTSVGYGSEVPCTFGGDVIGIFTMVLGMQLLAAPSGGFCFLVFSFLCVQK